MSSLMLAKSKLSSSWRLGEATVKLEAGDGASLAGSCGRRTAACWWVRVPQPHEVLAMCTAEGYSTGAT